MKKILITGANSYIGTSFESYMKQYDGYHIDTLDMIDPNWKKKDFSTYDAVFHVAGIAHADVGHVSEETKKLYYKVNTDLTYETAIKAKEDGVKLFIYMSSIIVYGESAPLGKKKVINKDTKPEPANFYGDSKLQADLKLQPLSDGAFKVCILRPPMIYGPGSKGNYQLLSKLAKKLPVFPDVKNERSMLFVGNLCYFIKKCIDEKSEGIYFPQNSEYVSTTEMVKEIAKVNGKKIHVTKILNPFVYIAAKIPGKIGGMCNKAFGNMSYENTESDYLVGLNDSVKQTEKGILIPEKNTKKNILLIALPGYSNGIKSKMENMGYNVVHINDKPNDGVVCKTLGRLQLKFYIKRIHNYYKKQIEKFDVDNFDFIVSIRGEYTPIETLKLLSAKYPTAKRILYMWDSIKNNKKIDKKWTYYNNVYTFDRIDFLNNKKSLKFLPLYYYEDYLPTLKANQYKYDIAFIGTGHGDRVKISNLVKETCQKNDLQYFSFLFLPHFLIYIQNKLFNKDYRNVKKKDIRFKMMPIKKAYEIYGESKCVVDVESKTQNGLTMRTIEMIGLKKKLITTNKDIVNYDFYNENNILVVDRNNFKLDTDFINKPYQELDERIYKKYSLESWIKTLLEE